MGSNEQAVACGYLCTPRLISLLLVAGFGNDLQSDMMHKQLFVTGVRLFGVWEMLRLIDYALEAYDMKAGFYKSSVITIDAAYAHILIYLVVGLYLLNGAPHVVDFFYPSMKAEDNANKKQVAPDA